MWPASGAEVAKLNLNPEMEHPPCPPSKGDWIQERVGGQQLRELPLIVLQVRGQQLREMPLVAPQYRRLKSPFEGGGAQRRGMWPASGAEVARQNLNPQTEHPPCPPSKGDWIQERVCGQQLGELPLVAPQHPRKARAGERGFVLVVVLWVLAILTILTIGFGRRAMMDRAAATYTLDHDKAMYMARGAVARGIIELQNKSVYDLVNKQGGFTGMSQQWAKPKDLMEDTQAFGEEKGEEQKDDVCMYIIRDEGGRISINNAEEKLLEEVEGLSRSSIRKIMTRRRGEDKEEGDLPHAPVFQTIEEVRNFDGISDDEWFGTEKQPGLKDILTCWGDTQVNINTAPQAVLECIPDLSESAVESIVDYRAGADGELFTEDDQDFRTLDEVPENAGVSADAMEPLRAFCKTQSGLFTITGVATRRNGKIRATCVATIVAMNPVAIIKWREEVIEP